MNDSKEMKTAKGLIIGILAGSVAGALTALLYAPKSGKELRKDISEKKDKMIDDAGRYLKDKKDHASEMLTEGKKKAESAIEETKKKIDEVKVKTGRFFSGGKEKIATETMLISDAVKAGIEAYRGERNSLH